MAGTFRSIAQLIRDGDLTMTECSARLGITRVQLENRLRLMEHMGYIHRRGGAQDTMDRNCVHCGSSCCRNEPRQIPVFFFLTIKGEILLQHKCSCSSNSDPILLT